jgi:hypothetical protein
LRSSLREVTGQRRGRLYRDDAYLRRGGDEPMDVHGDRRRNGAGTVNAAGAPHLHQLETKFGTNTWVLATRFTARKGLPSWRLSARFTAMKRSNAARTTELRN